MDVNNSDLDNSDVDTSGDEMEDDLEKLLDYDSDKENAEQNNKGLDSQVNSTKTSEYDAARISIVKSLSAEKPGDAVSVKKTRKKWSAPYPHLKDTNNQPIVGETMKKIAGSGGFHKKTSNIFKLSSDSAITAKEDSFHTSQVSFKKENLHVSKIT